MPINHLSHGLANVFCKELDDKYVLLVGRMVSVINVYLYLFSMKTAADNMQTN